MINDIFSTIGQAISGVIANMTSAFSSITALFYTPGTGSNPGQFTFLGVLLLVMAGVGLVYFAWRVIYRLIVRIHD